MTSELMQVMVIAAIWFVVGFGFGYFVVPNVQAIATIRRYRRALKQRDET